MPKENKDLHGSAPDQCKVALLIIDMLNDFDFEDGQELYNNTIKIAENVHKLKLRFRQEGMPVVYVNDNFGKWKSNLQFLIDHCIEESKLGKPIAEMLKPDYEDYFVLKPKHSGFFSTTLELLLQYLGAEYLVMTGITTDICLLFTANDAYLREFKLIVPQDCCAAVKQEYHDSALAFMQRILKADIRNSNELDFKFD